MRNPVSGNLFRISLLLAFIISGGPVSAGVPFILQEDKTVRELFGYEPEYTENVVTFDSLDRPYIRSRGSDIDETGFIHTLRNGEWIKIDFLPAIRKAYPNFEATHRAAGINDTRVIFDRNDRFYTILTIRLSGEPGKTILLYSTDFGKTIRIAELPRDSVPVEHRSGQNELAGPPLLMLSTPRQLDLPGDWARVNRLSIVQPRWEDDEIIIPEPVEISDMLLSIGQHSGGSSLAVSRDGKTHIVWVEATEQPDPPGSPTFAATIDQKTGLISDPVFVANSTPANNSHNVPGICIDSEGILHVVTGAHYGQSFLYTHSLAPNQTDGGWSEPEPVWARGWTATAGNEAGGQTYVALVCDPNDTLHLVFRHWRRQTNDFPHLVKAPGGFFASLAYQRKPKSENWIIPRSLIIPARNIYSIYYHKLSINRAGSLFLSASYMDQELLKKSPTERFLERMILTSPDGGDSWKLAETSDFLPPGR